MKSNIDTKKHPIDYYFLREEFVAITPWACLHAYKNQLPCTPNSVYDKPGGVSHCVECDYDWSCISNGCVFNLKK